MNIFWRIIAFFATFGCLVAGIFTGTNNSDLTGAYKANVKSVAFYENKFENAVPQTEMYNIISDFYKSAGQKEKKVIVIGYDGCRADNLVMCSEAAKSGIKTLLADGGHAVISYCGGVNYPQINTQDTSTAPGWCSMLTGQWADVHGITGNGINKSNDTLSLLTTLVESKTIDSSAFYVSWGGHFTSTDSTYYLEKQYDEEKQLDVKMLKASDDNGTYANVIEDLEQKECSDFIFSIFEYCDHYGHGTGFCMNNPDQKTGFAEQEQVSADVIKAIKARENYENEDWLILITSDHGGYNTWHGGPTMQERYTFIVSNKALSAYVK